jgi:glycosyltransferase involved in cell wall biosynthesis
MLGQTRAEGKGPSVVPYALHVRPVIRAGHVRQYLYLPSVAPVLLRRVRPDVVYVEAEADSLVLWQLARWKQRLGYRLVMFGWENLPRAPVDGLRVPRRIVRSGLNRLESWTMARVDTAIWGNSEGAERLRARGYPRTVHVLPQLGVDLSAYSPGDGLVAKRELGFAPGQLLVGYVGRLVRAKGLLTLCRALEPRLAVGSVGLLILGAGPLGDELAAWVAERGLQQVVHLLPPVPFADVPRYMRALDVLALPSETTSSWKEQFGHVLIEAMACGVPVVGSGSGAIPEVVGEAGLLFPEGDALALRERLDRLLDDADLRRSLAERGRERVERRYSNAVIAAHLHAILEGQA